MLNIEIQLYSLNGLDACVFIHRICDILLSQLFIFDTIYYVNYKCTYLTLVNDILPLAKYVMYICVLYTIEEGHFCMFTVAEDTGYSSLLIFFLILSVCRLQLESGHGTGIEGGPHLVVVVRG